MISGKDLFKSRIFIILFSMAVNIILILIGFYWFDNNYIHLELSLLLLLSLLLGPFSILGFTIVEILYWVLFLGMTDISTIILTTFSLLVLGIVPWKLWYSLNYQKRFEIPNLNSFYSFFKIIVIGLIMIIQTYFLFNLIFIKTVNLNLESYFMIITFGLILLLGGIGLFGRFNIATFTPTVQFKEFMPERLYRFAFIISIILSILTFNDPNEFWLVIILILSIIFLFKPFDEEVFKISDFEKITVFYELFFSVFFIVILIPTVLLISFTLVGSSGTDFASEFLNYLLILSGFFLAILIPLVIYLLFLESQVINPINQLSRYLSEEITNNEGLENLIDNLDSITVNNEIRSLSESILNMEEEYMDYTNNLLEVTKEKERYETELKLAQEIQSSMLPTDFESFYENDNFLLWGFMKSAYNVGGDFYDYFRIDDENIGVVIGDVSGKGVSAALVMVKAMTLIRDYTIYYSDLSDAFHEINNELYKDNVEGLYVSCWFGKLNTKTGELVYVNAGHPNPLIKQDDGNFEFLNTKSGVILAKMEDMHYNRHIIHLKSNDVLFMYSNGVTDAKDDNDGIYGEENLQKMLNQNNDKELSVIIKSIENDINEFRNKQVQFDDEAMFIIKRI